MKRTMFFTLLCLVMSAYSAPKKEPYFGGIWQSGSGSPSSTTFPDFEQLYNQVTPESAGKLKYAWATRDTPNWATVDSMYAYANARGWFIKQHAFVWKASTPPWFETMIRTAQWDSVRESTYEFMRQYFTRYPLTTAADIANETAKNVPVLGRTMYTGHDTGQIHWWQAFQPGLYVNGQHLVWNTAMEATYRQWDWLIPIYRKARELTRELAPNCKLILNDHTLLRDAVRRDLFISQVKKLKAEGLIDYMGEQGHHIGDLSSVQIQTELDILAKETGIPLIISEFDIRDNEVEVNGKPLPGLGSDSLQLVYMKNVFPPIWEHPNTIGVTLWGYMEGHHWRPTAYLVKKDGTYRPAMTWLMKYKNGSTRLLEAETNDEKSSTMQVLNGSITSISPNNYLKFSKVKMESFKVIVVKYSVTDGYNDSIDVRLNSVSGMLLATIPIINTKSMPSIATADLKNEGVEGDQDIYFVFRGAASMGTVDWFKFRGGNGIPQDAR